MTQLSVAMIVKNEEVMLARCLESVKEADEIVICDTGSTDRTIEIAREYTDKVYTDYVWNDNFGEARNHAISKCTGDWILIIDADEILLSTISEIKEIIEDADVEGIMCTTIGEGSQEKSESCRIIKKHIRYIGEIHETPAVRKKKVAEIFIQYGSSPAHRLDPDIDLRILEKVAEKENYAVPRTLYYLAREYYYRKRWDEAIELLDKYIPISKWLPERNDACLMKARCLSSKKKWIEACDSAWEALKYNANFKEALIFISQHMDPVNAERWRSFAELADNRDVVFVRV
jgi:glycosyltransferase involved in cell wall biosynthesis